MEHLVTARSRWTGLVVGLSLLAYVALVDPARRGLYPRCPSRLLLGLDCPFCGGLRGTHDLLHGDLAGALDHNLLLPAYLIAAAVLVGTYLMPLIGRPAPRIRLPRWTIIAAAVVVVAFTVARNLPGFDYLASGAG
jgi:ABC-type branched-subunit amino acid transport system permease subunit